MIDDAALPRGFRPSSSATVERQGVFYTAACWTPDDLVRLTARLETVGGPALRELSEEALLSAWSDAVEAFRDPRSPERRQLDPALARFSRLSPPGLAAALDAVLGSVDRGLAASLSSQAAGSDPRPVLVFLTSAVPALAVQPLLPALLLRRPVILRSASAEPLFAAAFTRALAARQPVLGQAVAALTWPGGIEALAAPLVAAAGRVLAYGRAATNPALPRLAQGGFSAYGPKASLAVLAEDVDPTRVAPGIARDVALFDQRSCLSVQAIYCASAPIPLAQALAAELRRLGESWPAGPLNPVDVAAVHQLRSDARMRALQLPELPIDLGTVIVEPRPDFQPSPGVRTVRIHPVESLRGLPEILAPRAGDLQGAALAGKAAEDLAPALEKLGLSRLVGPGELQSPGDLWHHGGAHPLEVLR